MTSKMFQLRMEIWQTLANPLNHFVGCVTIKSMMLICVSTKRLIITLLCASMIPYYIDSYLTWGIIIPERYAAARFPFCKYSKQSNLSILSERSIPPLYFTILFVATIFPPKYLDRQKSAILGTIFASSKILFGFTSKWQIRCSRCLSRYAKPLQIPSIIL